MKQESPAVHGVAAVPTGAPGAGHHDACRLENPSGLVKGSPLGPREAFVLIGGPEGATSNPLPPGRLTDTTVQPASPARTNSACSVQVSRQDPEAGPNPVCSEGIWNVPVSTFHLKMGTP